MLGDVESILDLRGNYLSCCMYNYSEGRSVQRTTELSKYCPQHPQLNSVILRYWSLNASAPLLPSGLSFSSRLGPVAGGFVGRLNLTGIISCPYLYNGSLPDEPQNLLSVSTCVTPFRPGRIYEA